VLKTNPDCIHFYAMQRWSGILFQVVGAGSIPMIDLKGTDTGKQ
jgi:hypothetical protein